MSTLTDIKGREKLIDGSKGTFGMAKDHAEWRDRQQITTRCALCRMLHRGTAADGREWARAHREGRHPAAAASPRRRLTVEQQREAAMLKNAWRRKKFVGEEG